MSVTLSARQFKVWMSERSYRYKEEALYSHAPQTPGIYQLVTFDEQQNATVVFMAHSGAKSIFDTLYQHWRGEREPKVQDLLGKYPNLYFSYVVEADAQSPEDWQDLFVAMVKQDKPLEPKLSDLKPSGRYSDVTYKDQSIL